MRRRLFWPTLVALSVVAVGFARDPEQSSMKWGYIVARKGGSSHVDWQNTGAAFRNGQLNVSSGYLKRMDFSKEALAQVIVPDRGWFYVRRDGKSLAVITFDNGADYFAQGLTRSKVDGKVAYFDLNFHQVIPPKYDWGWPFEDGKALVCNGCRKAPRDSEGHSLMVGGQWGFIDRTGKEIVPVTWSREEALRQSKADR